MILTEFDGLNAWLPPETMAPTKAQVDGARAMTADEIAALELRMADKMRNSAASISSAVFQPGVFPVVEYRPSLGRRLWWEWYAARVWVAEKVLRVAVEGGDE